MNRRGFTVTEVVIAALVFALVGLISVASLLEAARVWRNTSGRDSALRDLTRARQALQEDLSRAIQPATVSLAPASLGGGADSDALGMITAVNETTQDMTLDLNGRPFPIVNVLYYLSVPTDHSSLYGYACNGGNSGGYDCNCPHKELLRVVVDQVPSNDPTVTGAAPETLLTSLTPYLTRPTGFPKAPDRRVVAINLLTMRINLTPVEAQVDLRAVSLLDAQKNLGIGNSALDSTRYTIQHRFSVFFKN